MMPDTRAWRCPLLLGGALALLFAPALGAQQAAPTVLSNLEQASSGLNRSTPVLPPTAGPLLVPEDFSKVPLTSGTLLDLRVYRVPEISGALRVDEAGEILVPLLGKVEVLGKTPSMLQAEIAARMQADGWLVAPQVNVDVLQYALASTTVTGEVQAPGRVSLQAPKPLPAVLAMAGGETIAAGNDIDIQHIPTRSRPTAFTEHVRYLRELGPDPVAGIVVYPGDTVFVHRAGIVYVLGAVTRPGGYLMVDSGALDLTQAVALAQGTTLLASTHRVWIVRRQAGQVLEIPVEYAKVAKGKLPAPVLQAEDVVYVQVSALKTVLTNGSAVLSAASSAAIYAGTGH